MLIPFLASPSLYAATLVCWWHLGYVYSSCLIARVRIQWPVKPFDSTIYELLFKHLLYRGWVRSLYLNSTVRHNKAAEAIPPGQLQSISHATACPASRSFSTQQIHHRRCRQYTRVMDIVNRQTDTSFCPLVQMGTLHHVESRDGFCTAWNSVTPTIPCLEMSLWGKTTKLNIRYVHYLAFWCYRFGHLSEEYSFRC